MACDGPGCSRATRDGVPGQIEAELAGGRVARRAREPGDVFHEEPERLWEDVLRRLGPAFAVMRTMPADPSLN